jgi:hypothetical protein
VQSSQPSKLHCCFYSEQFDSDITLVIFIWVSQMPRAGSIDDINAVLIELLLHALPKASRGG